MNSFRLVAVFSYLKVFGFSSLQFFLFQKSKIKSAYNTGFAARLAGRWSNRHFIAVVLQPGRTYIVGLLFVNLYFYIFIQQRFRADTATIPALQQALTVVGKLKATSVSKIIILDRPLL